MSAAHRHPPAFQILIGRQAPLQGLIALLAAFSTASLLAGLALHFPALWWLELALPGIAWQAWRLARIEPRHLQWDGQLWRLAPATQLDPGKAVELHVLFDFGHWLLLRAQDSNSTAWLPARHYLPLSRELIGASWGQLRATLYSGRPESTDDP